MTKQGRYRIQTVSQMTGISTATLRAWERRYGIPKPVRGESSSYRLYSEDEVSMLKKLKTLCDQGLAPSEAIPLLSEDVGSLEHYDALLKKNAEAQAEAQAELSSTQDFSHQTQEIKVADSAFRQTPMSKSDGLRQAITQDPKISQTIDLILKAILDYQPIALENHIRSALGLGSPKWVFDEIFAPVLVKIGDLWSIGQLSIAQEHLASEYIGNATRDLLRLVQSDEGQKLILLACVENEFHTLPLYGSALHFIQWGYRVVILGANTPARALKESIMAIKPHAIGLSITQKISLEQAKPLMQGYADVFEDLPWMLGGQGCDHLKHYVEKLGGLVALGSPQEIKQKLEISISLQR